MTAKGSSSSSCCCPPGFIRLAPSVFAPGAQSITRLQDFCCECVPKYVCVGLYIGEVYEPSRIDFFIAPWNCVAQGETDTRLGNYRGTLVYNGVNYDISVEFYRDDYGLCYICLRSDELGYTGSNRVCFQLGGEGDCAPVRRAECLTMGFAFPVQIPSATTGYLVDATITVGPVQYSVPQRCKTCGPTTQQCVCRRVTMVYEVTGPGGVVTRESRKACVIDTYNPIYWTEDFGGGGITFTVVDYVANPRSWILLTTGPDAPTIVSYPEVVLPPCPDSNGNYCIYGASWDLITPEGYEARLTVSGDPHDYCTDCRYVCQVICFLFFSENGSEVVRAEINEFSQWTAEYLGKTYVVSLTCIGCADRETAVSLSTDATIVSGTNPAPIGTLCPNNIAATWQVEFAPGDVGYLSISCSSCDQCVNSIAVPCCADVLTPRVLWVTLVAPDCPYLHGVTVALTYQDSPPAPAFPGWVGYIPVLHCTKIDYLPATNVMVNLACIGVIWSLRIIGRGWVEVPPTAPGLGSMITFCPIEYAWSGIDLVQSTCSPFELYFTQDQLTTWLNTCCCESPYTPNVTAVVTR